MGERTKTFAVTAVDANEYYSVHGKLPAGEDVVRDGNVQCDFRCTPEFQKVAAHPGQVPQYDVGVNARADNAANLQRGQQLDAASAQSTAQVAAGDNSTANIASAMREINEKVLLSTHMGVAPQLSPQEVGVAKQAMAFLDDLKAKGQTLEDAGVANMGSGKHLHALETHKDWQAAINALPDPPTANGPSVSTAPGMGLN